MKKIAIDAGPLKTGDSVRGVGVYTRELISSLQELLSKEKIPIELSLLDYSNGDFGKINLEDYDIVHFTRFNPFGVSIPFRKPRRTRFILTIYDLIPLIYPNHYPPGIKGKIDWEVNKYLIRKKIDAVITISETSKKDICDFIGISSNNVNTIYLAPRKIFKKFSSGSWQSEIREKFSLPSHFVLYVGDINYNKNIPSLVKACKKAGLHLVIAGKQAKEIENMDLNHPELVHLKKVDWSGVLRLGFVQDEDLVKICNLADVYVQPSFYEGFGLPVLEALACDTPVACSNTKALVEILGNDVSYFDPYNVDDMARRILSPSKKVDLPRKYSWQKTAEETLRVYQSLL